MTSDEAAQVYGELHTILERSGLGWVSAEVRQEVAAGKAARKTLSVNAFFDSGEEFTFNTPRRRQRVEFLSTEPYSLQEQLQLLVDAIAQTVVGVANMQKSTLDLLTDGKGPRNVTFLPETPVIEGHGYSLADSEKLADGVKKLHDLLDELRGELVHVD